LPHANALVVLEERRRLEQGSVQEKLRRVLGKPIGLHYIIKKRREFVVKNLKRIVLIWGRRDQPVTVIVVAVEDGLVRLGTVGPIRPKIFIAARKEGLAGVVLVPDTDIDADRVAPAIRLVVNRLPRRKRSADNIYEALYLEFAGNTPFCKIDEARDLLINDRV